MIFMDLRRTQKLFNTGDAVSSIEVQIRDPFEADLIAGKWKESLDNVKVEDWMELNQQLLTALSSQSSSSYTIQFFVILSITLGIASVLAVSVIQKSKEIGILKAMGITKKSTSRIFILQGLLLGILGSFAGIGLGILLSAVLIRLKVCPSASHIRRNVPVGGHRHLCRRYRFGHSAKRQQI